MEKLKLKPFSKKIIRFQFCLFVALSQTKKHDTGTRPCSCFFQFYGVGIKADMLSKFEIALKECSETEGWLQLLFNTNGIDEDTHKKHRNLCGRIRRMLISTCKTLK